MALKVILSLFLLVISQVLVLPPGLHLPTQWFGHLMWVALVPFFLGITKQTHYRRVWGWSYLLFVFYFVFHLYWFTVAIHIYGGVPALLSVGALVAYGCLLGIYGAGAMVVAIWLTRNTRCPLPINFAVAMVAAEFLRAHTLTGFPWGNFSDSQSLANLPIVQWAELLGQNGILFFIVGTNAVLMQVWRDRSWLATGHLRRFSVLWLVVIVLAHVWGWSRLGQVRRAYGVAEKGKTYRVQTLQGNIPQEEKWDPEKANQNIERYKALRQQRSSEVVLTVWPEAAFPFFIEEGREQIDALAQDGLYQIIGIPTEDRVHRRAFNSAYLLSPKGALLSRYDKTHLVPFGEYVPYRFVFGMFGRLVPGIGDFSPGNNFEPFEIKPNDSQASSILMGILICYEDIFSEIADRQRRAGADIFVNLTNDAWYGRTSAAFQHLAMSIYRAVENRRVLLRATNTGVTALISPAGEALQVLPWFSTAALEVNLPYGHLEKIGEGLPYEWFSWANIGWIVGAFLWVRRRKKPRP